MIILLSLHYLLDSSSAAVLFCSFHHAANFLFSLKIQRLIFSLTRPQRSHMPKSVWDQFIIFLSRIAVDERSRSVCDHVQNVDSDHASSIMCSCCWTWYSLVRPQTLNYSKIAQEQTIRGYFIESINSQ